MVRSRDRTGHRSAGDRRNAATLTTLTFKSPQDRIQATRNLAELLPLARQLAGFCGFTLIQLGEATATMVTLYTSEGEAEAASGHFHPHLAGAIGPHVGGAPERVAGPVLLHD